MKVKLFKLILLALVSLAVLSELLLILGGFVPQRELSRNELILAKIYYPENLDLSKVRLTFNTVFSTFSSVTLGDKIHIKTSNLDLKSTNDLTQTIGSQYLLIHELEHVYQYQNDGLWYIPKSLYAQLLARITTGSRNGAYNWQEAMMQKKPWDMWNPEEQAEAISDYFYYRTVGFNSDKIGEQAKKLGCFAPQLEKQFCIK